MIITCNNCKNKISIDDQVINLEGKLISCIKCKEKWVYQSHELKRTIFLENKLFELDQDLNKKELKINELNIKYSEKISLLEKDLLSKKKELEKQRLLEERISVFEKRVTDTEKLNSQQANLETLLAKVEKEVKATSESIEIKNESIEKKTNYLEMKIKPYNHDNEIKEPIAVNESQNGVVNFSGYEQDNQKNKQRTKSVFFWNKNSDK